MGFPLLLPLRLPFLLSGKRVACQPNVVGDLEVAPFS